MKDRDIKKILGDINNYLKEKGVSQSDLAKRMGVSTEHFSRVINGKAKLSKSFELKFREASGGHVIKDVLQENEEYERRVAALEQEVKELVKQIEILDEENTEHQKSLNEANKLIRDLLKKLGIPDPD